ncbi:hypothetical protein OJAV_G00120360 [Oryzias javanicus]|uniref:Bromo domain-containing protein n=1 Tax=Oryzias javanicus TaxID=123683 RepID=A0A437CTQ7_ORYJA|nr:hypothetical protein OJAV_G00120360 [Oryzias javanicus]
MYQDVTDQITAACIQLPSKDLALVNQRSGSLQIPSGIMSSQSKWLDRSSGDTTQVTPEDGLRNGSYETEATLGGAADHLSACHNGISEFSNSDILLPEVCISSNSNSFEEDMNYEVQQAYKIFSVFLLDKHKGLTSPFFHPTDDDDNETQEGIEGVQGRVQSQLGQSMCLQRIKEKFINKEYETITEFVADFRQILENCYRCHGVDHWISKQGQKLEIMLEQKLTLLSRPLREKTTLAVTSKGRFGNDEERGSGSSSTRRRLAPRSLATITVGGHESVMVQTLRLEEQQRAKEEKRQRELEKKEAGEMSAKEVEEWEQSLLSQAFPQSVDTLWELPAIGHFLCLAQAALNLPEIVFFELERCLLMPRCSLLLSKVMSSLLSPPHRRATLHRRPALPYRRWESELRQRVSGWYRTVGSSRNQPHRAEQLGLCHQFFCVVGEESPLEDRPFHLLPFYQRVWLLKGLCDHVYETQKDVQDTVLAQPIHECRESILGYDSKENAYIHFPHFCGADLRIYCQQPSSPPPFPFPSKLVKRVDFGLGVENEANKNGGACDATFMESEDDGKKTVETRVGFKTENGDTEESAMKIQLWPAVMTNVSESGSSGSLVCEDSKVDLKTHANSLPLKRSCHFGVIDSKTGLNTEILDDNKQSKWEQRPSMDRNIKEETQASHMNVEEHSYTGRSPACSENLCSLPKFLELRIEDTCPIHGNESLPSLDCRKKKTGSVTFAECTCVCEKSDLATKLSPRNPPKSREDLLNDKMWTKKRKHKKEPAEEPLQKKEHKQLQHEDGLFQTKASESVVSATTKRKDKKKSKTVTGKETEYVKKIKAESLPESSFKLVCSSLGDLRELISKIEDELDDLESTKKRLGRWFNRREAVKDLHSTLIRLLNELTPWEPKLVKAYHRNRLRMKKEFDDFKRNPEYNNFIREECVSSSLSDDDYDDEETSTERNLCLENLK